MLTKDINELYKKFRSQEGRLPLFIIWELTYRCQNKCVHCYQMETCKTRKEVSTEIVISVLKELKSRGTMRITYSGGDPFVRNDFMNILEESRKLGFDISVFSSGQAISFDVAKSLKKLNISGVEVTFLGAEASTHNKLANSNYSFEKLISAIENLKRNKVNILAKYILMKPNYKELDGFISLCKTYKIAHKIDASIYEPWGTEGIVQKYMLNDQDMYDYFCKYNHIIPQKSPATMCNAGYINGAITPYGSVVPCNTYGDKVVFGNIIENKFYDIWFSKEAVQFRSKFPKNKIIYNICKECKDSQFCNLCFGFSYGLKREEYIHICQASALRRKAYERKINEDTASI